MLLLKELIQLRSGEQGLRLGPSITVGTFVQVGSLGDDLHDLLSFFTVMGHMREPSKRSHVARSSAEIPQSEDHWNDLFPSKMEDQSVLEEFRTFLLLKGWT